MATFRISITVPHTFEYDIQALDTQQAERLGRIHYESGHKPRIEYLDNNNAKAIVKLVNYND